MQLKRCCSRKKKIWNRLKAETQEEKSLRLQAIAGESGLAYDSQTNIFRKQDRGGSGITDCETVWFVFGGCTWMLMLKKGQYGVSTGAEAELYFTNDPLFSEDRKQSALQKISGNGFLQIQFQLYRDREPLYGIMPGNGGAAIICPGIFSRPEQLMLEVTLAFQNREMQYVFLEEIRKMGYRVRDNLFISENTVCLQFSSPITVQISQKRLYKIKIRQFKNSILTNLFRLMSRKETDNIDNILYIAEKYTKIFHIMFER